MGRTGTWLIYGANGFTGQLIAREALARGMRPTLAGRSRAAVESLGRALGCETRALPLAAAPLTRALEEFDCVLMAAGPFARTDAPMLESCLDARCHYLDLSGELDTLTACYGQHERALTAGVAVVPAVGFSVVPMDCLATLLAGVERPNALSLAFEGYELSPGSVETYAAGLAHGHAETRREAGSLVRSPLRWELVPIPLQRGTQQALCVAYAELESSFRPAGVPNISVFMLPTAGLAPQLNLGARVAPLMRFDWISRAVIGLAAQRFGRPRAAAGRAARTQIWGCVRFADGSQRHGLLTTDEPYVFSARCALAAVQRVLAGHVPGGAWTPSQAFGPRFVLEVGDCTLELEERSAGAA